LPRRQFLWIDTRGADSYFLGADNLEASAGDKGTLAIWQWAFGDFGNNDLFWRYEIDANNYMRQWRGRTFRVCSAGVQSEVSVTNATYTIGWEHLVYTWDFSVPGAGQMHLYWNGNPGGTAITDANAPVGSPGKLSLGPFADTDTWGPAQIYSLGVWNDVMTAEQVAAVYEQGNRWRPTESDGNGSMLLRASFDGQYDADVAAGDPTFHADGAADRYCLIDDGAREQGLRKFLIGTPRHDLSEHDRVPLGAVCPLTRSLERAPFVVDTNYANYGELEVLAGYTQERRVGGSYAKGPVFEASCVPGSSTYRQRVHIPNDGAPAGRAIRLGPIDYVHYPTKAENVYDEWGSGRRFTVVDDPGNTGGQFKTDLDERYVTDEWAGADVTVLTGNCAGRRLKVTGYDSVTKVLSLESALPATPAAGSLAVVDHRARLRGCRSWGSTDHGKPLPQVNMDAWLWEFHGDGRLFTELEWQYFEPNSGDLLTPNFLRYNRGRTVFMDGAQHSNYEYSGCYGKPSKYEDNTLACKILIESIELETAGSYQLIRRRGDGGGPDLADNFMVRRPGGQSTKVWRSLNVTRSISKPTKCPSPADAKADLQAAGTWRQSIQGTPVPIQDHDAEDSVIALVVGTDSEGVTRLGYVEGVWDEGTGRISWDDEAPPAGRSNPFMLLSELRPTREADGQYEQSTPNAVLQTSDGKWSLVYEAQTSHPDHFMAYLLSGAEDRWSFSAEQHWWPGNPITPIVGGPDVLAPDGNGYGVWGNRDASWKVVENPYTEDASRRYMGFARGKSIGHRADKYAMDLRPLTGVRGADLRSMTPLPHGNCVSPLVGPQVHIMEVGVLGQSDCIGLYTDTAVGFTSGVYSYVSEDGIHFQLFADHTDWLPQGQLPGEPTRLSPGRPFRLGDKRIYYYSAQSFVNFGWMRLDGEAWYELSDGETEGFLETCIVEMPAEGWGRLLLNLAPNDGECRVAVIDAETEEAIPGFAASDMDAVWDSVAGTVTWNGVGLDSVPATSIRFGFSLSVADAADASPQVYAWRVASPEEVLPPSATDLRVEGDVRPTNVSDPTPEFTWSYSDASGLEQTAYQLLLASSKEDLDANIGDLWDTGVVESSETQATFEGAQLAANTVHFWKVRVRNAQGVWSEEW